MSRINAYREVREMRFELIHRNRHYPLKVACLPIPPLAQNVSSFMRSPPKAVVVPKTGLEPARRETLAPETSASTNSATWASLSLSSLGIRPK